MMFILVILTIELIVEFTGLIDDNYRPILNLITKKGDPPHPQHQYEEEDNH